MPGDEGISGVFRVLILGGTGEARQLAERFVSNETIAVTLSLAGRTSDPALPGTAVRHGGFGGIAGLTRFLAENAVSLVVDATHPFATQMTANAVLACRALNLPLLTLRRPPWPIQQGDQWTVVDTLSEVCEQVEEYDEVFFTVGSQDILDIVQGCPTVRGVARMIEQPKSWPAKNVKLLFARPPFSVEDETAFLKRHMISAIVAKNSGGEQTYAKIAAARDLKIPVIMVARPSGQPTPDATDVHHMEQLIRDYAA